MQKEVPIIVISDSDKGRSLRAELHHAGVGASWQGVSVLWLFCCWGVAISPVPLRGVLFFGGISLFLFIEPETSASMIIQSVMF